MSSSASPPKASTIREQLREALRMAPANALELSQCVGIAEREVAGHLEHLGRSLKPRGERLVVTPATCLDCGFEFGQRERLTRPGSCPACRGSHIARPRFHIA